MILVHLSVYQSSTIINYYQSPIVINYHELSMNYPLVI